MAEIDLGRVKRNVGKMLTQGAPEADIDAYIAGEGTTIDAVKAHKSQPYSLTGELAAPFAGFNKGFDALLNLPGQALNLGARTLGFDAPFQPIELASRANAGYEPKTLAGRTAETIGEVAGASVLPEAGMLARANQLAMLPQKANTLAAPVLASRQAASSAFQRMAAQGPLETSKQAIAPTIGAGVGTQAAKEMDLGPAGEIAGGLLGGIALPNAANIASRTYGGIKAGAQYAGRQIERARDPQTAAYRDIADEMSRAGLDPQQVYSEVSPKIDPRSNLNRRINPQTGEVFNEGDMADMVSRRMAGEHPDDIASDYGVSGGLVKKYTDDFIEANPTERNLIDIGKQTLGSGGAQPLSNQARNDMGIADDPIAAQRLIGRQRTQPGRVANIIEQSRISGRTLDEELEHLATTGKTEERAAYGKVRDEAQPIELRGVLEKARRIAHSRAGEIREGLNEAIDLFFQPVAQPKRISAMEDVRMAEMRERIAKAEAANNPDPVRIAQLKRRFDAMRDDAEYSANAKPVITKPGSPIKDVGRFIDAREELSQLIKRSMQDGKSTPLTALLTEFRRELNAAARSSNKSLEAADAKFSENRSIESIIERGQDLGKKLTPQTKRALREFGKLTPTQQEIQRVAFENKIASEALGVKKGNAAADQFQTEAFDKIVETMYTKSAGKEVYERGQTLLKQLRGEAISTETARDVLSGSRTAPMQEGMKALLEGPRAAADALTGRWSKIVENLSNRLTRQIGKQAATERVRILTETDLAKMLPMLKRLAQEAKTSGERQLYATALREFAKVPRNVIAETGAIGRTDER